MGGDFKQILKLFERGGKKERKRGKKESKRGEKDKKGKKE